MTTATPAKAKKPTPQADVRIVGGKTTVKLRAYGETTLARVNALLAELRTNAHTHPEVTKAAGQVRDAIVALNLALGFSGLGQAGDEKV